MTFEHTLVASPCRFCGLPAFGFDGDGFLHPCCQYWWGLVGRCPACSASREAARQQRDRRR